ncbi:MAG: protease pro-enzyme activation domain-containing protein [Thermodesulfovibrionales bacterium]|jgi:hypothetical protein
MRGVIKGFFVSIVMLVGSAMLFPASPSLALSSRAIDNNDTVVLSGNVYPLARPEFDKGPTQPSMRMERMILTLHLSASKQAELNILLTELYDPASPNFHHWLTPEEFGMRFGPSSEDINAITAWLVSNGFVVDEVAKGHSWINFSGTVADIGHAFHTQIHNYYVNGQLYHANATDPSIPRGLSDLVAGVVSLHDFPRKMMNSGIHTVQPDYTSGSTHYLSPGDFATIYDVTTLYSSGTNGTGQNIAIVGRTHPSTASSDWATFRSTMGLPANPPQVIVNGNDPGDLGLAEDTEADLDVEWSGAVATNASILFVTSKSTHSTDGVDLSAQYIVDKNLAAVMSTSFGSCEMDMGTAENSFYNNLWQQAATQGITSFVASGDAGAAGCNAGSDTTGSQLAVNGLASTPYNVAVGGNEFNEGSGNYWNTANGPGYTSAISYIPEVAWNESGDVSGGSGLWSTGGGISSIYAKPAWQVAPGVPAANSRYVPDVALSAAGHDGYLVVIQGGLYAVGGTSASSPSFGGLMALAVQKTGQRQGNANVRLYQLGSAQYGSGGSAVFHDITSGNNSVPGVTGYTCTPGYDLATGLGSVDANALVSNWMIFTISASPSAASVDQGSSVTTTINTAVWGGFSSAVILSASGLPQGVTAAFSPSTIASPGSGSSTLIITAGASSATGVFPVTVSGSGGGITQNTIVNLTVIPVFNITASVTGIGGTINPATLSVVSGDSATLTITPTADYYLASLTDNGNNVTSSVSGSSYTITDVTSAHTVVATFAIDIYTVSASVSSGSGSITPSNSYVAYGSNVTLTIDPAGGYSLGGLTDNGTSVAATESQSGTFTYTIYNISSDHTVLATFSQEATPPVSSPAMGPWGFVAAALGLGLALKRKNKI